MNKQFQAPTFGPVTFACTADALWLEVITDPSTTVATAGISGPAEVVDAIRASMDGTTWTLAFPHAARPGGIVFGGGGVTTVISGGYQNVMMSGGRIIINGVDVTAAVNAAQPGPLRAVVHLPAGSSLDARVAAGNITTTGPLAGVRTETTSADLNVTTVGTIEGRTVSGDIEVGTAAGTARLSSTSGDIVIRDARSPVNAHAVSGDINVYATQAVTVDASTVSGDIRVASPPGVHPDVHGRSVSGRVRTLSNE